MCVDVLAIIRLVTLHMFCLNWQMLVLLTPLANAWQEDDNSTKSKDALSAVSILFSLVGGFKVSPSRMAQLRVADCSAP